MRAILALLAINADRVVSVASLIDALWCGVPPRTAGTALQVYVSRLRKHDKAIAADLVTKPPGYVFTMRSHECDLRTFESLNAQSEAAQADGHTEEAAWLLRDALGLWTGPALADMRSLPVLDGLAEQLDERRTIAYERRIELELTLGRHAALVSELRWLISEHPMWENLYYFLMLSLYRCGRTAESLKTYCQARSMLLDTLGMEPGAHVQQLHRAILSRATWLDEVGPAATVMVDRVKSGAEVQCVT